MSIAFFTLFSNNVIIFIFCQKWMNIVIQKVQLKMNINQTPIIDIIESIFDLQLMLI